MLWCEVYCPYAFPKISITAVLSYYLSTWLWCPVVGVLVVWFQQQSLLGMCLILQVILRKHRHLIYGHVCIPAGGAWSHPRTNSAWQLSKFMSSSLLNVNITTATVLFHSSSLLNSNEIKSRKQMLYEDLFKVNNEDMGLITTLCQRIKEYILHH